MPDEPQEPESAKTPSEQIPSPVPSSPDAKQIELKKEWTATKLDFTCYVNAERLPEDGSPLDE